MRKCVNWLFLAGAGLFLVFGVIVFYYAILPFFIRKQVSKTLALNNGTEAWDRFVKLPVPIKFGVYFFNIVNLDEFLQGGKPIVQEVGPWVYKQTREKYNIVVNDEKDTVTYQQKSFFHFDAEASKPLTENDYVQPANIIPQIVNTLAERAPNIAFLNEVLDLGFHEVLRENYVVRLNRTVNEILFSGITAFCPSNSSLAALTICSVLRHFPGIENIMHYPNGDMNVGVLRFRNNTLGKPVEVYRGNKDFDKIGQILTVNGKTMENTWYGESCNHLEGSYDESLLKPFLTEDSSFSLFATDLCSTIPMTVQRSTSFKGIDCLEFGTGKQFLKSVYDYPENYCYCTGSVGGITLGQSCMRTGAMELSACHAVPVVLSLPHFYGASSHYQNAVGGLKPSDTHRIFLDLEPTTGIPLKGARRIQINFQIKGTPAMTMTGKAPDTLMPFLWIDEEVELLPEQINMLKDMLLKMLKILNIVKWVLIAVGCLMVLVGGVGAWISGRKERLYD